jgi:two-component sensor histidine kinase
MSWKGSGSPVWDLERLRVASDAAGIALWSWNVDSDEIALDGRAESLWGLTKKRSVTFEDLSARIHPSDLDRVRTAFEATRQLQGAYEIDFRILVGDAVRWISARGQGDDIGIVDRVMFGVFLDVTDRKTAEEAREMLAGEMSHRVKNLFAIASALTAIAARSAATTTEMAHDLTQRLNALGRAHDLIRPVPSEGNKEALLGSLLAVLLAPYRDEGPAKDRVHVSVPDVCVGETGATTLALIVHELATNSVKYGALSVLTGTLNISCVAHNDEVVLVWTEWGGPPVSSLSHSAGFGSRLVERSISGQLGGAITFDWPVEGVIVTMRMNKARLAT